MPELKGESGCADRGAVLVRKFLKARRRDQFRDATGTPSTHDARAMHSLGLKGLVVAVCAATLAAYVVTDSMSAHAGRDVVTSFVPQGWTFFTRPPRAGRVRLFRHTTAGWRPVTPAVSADPSDLIGWGRHARARALELADVVSHVPPADFALCQRAEIARCLDEATTAYQTFDDYREAHICGDLAIVLEEPPPWVDGQPGPQSDPLVLRATVQC
jgi:antimicrobial peptide system SdpA family protein